MQSTICLAYWKSRALTLFTQASIPTFAAFLDQNGCRLFYACTALFNYIIVGADASNAFVEIDLLQEDLLEDVAKLESNDDAGEFHADFAFGYDVSGELLVIVPKP